MKNNTRDIPFSEYRPRLIARLRAFLFSQENSLSRYLLVLEKITQDLREENMSRLETHIQMEQALIREITGNRKVLIPLENLLGEHETGPWPELTPIQTQIDRIRKEALRKNLENQALLSRRLPVLRDQISRVKTRPGSGFTGSREADSRYLNISA